MAEQIIGNMAGEGLSILGKMAFPQRPSAGTLNTRFLTEIRDNQRIMGIRCPQCNKVYVPPRGTCFRCFSNLEEWIELSGNGTVASYTVVDYLEPFHPIKAPFALANIRLDGADSDLTHLLSEVDLDKITIGMKVQPVFKEHREGNILDIEYFKPL